MIDLTMTVSCDGELDGDLCPAEFVIENYGGWAISPMHFAHQLAQRGWRVDRDPASNHGHLVTCPLHRTTEDGE